MAGHGICDVAQAIELFVSEHIDEAMPDRFEVDSGGRFNGLLAGGGEDDIEAAGVVLAWRAGDGAASLHAGDLI